MTRVAFPTNGNNIDAEIAEHFGRAQNFLVYDMESGSYEVYANPEVAGKAILPPRFLYQHEVTDVVCFGLGHKAAKLFKELGISVFKAEEGLIRDNIKRFKDSVLSRF